MSQDDELHVHCSDESCTAMLTKPGRIRAVAVAELNALESPSAWWVARVLVSDEKDRGKGYGSRVLQVALAEATKKTGLSCRVIVTPYGYDGDERKFSFYEKNGFVKIEPDGLYEWRPL